MIKTLQKKFILAAMAAVTVLLLFMLGAINGINYWMTQNQAEHTLNMLSENEGRFPPPQEPRKEGPFFFPPRSDREFTMSSRFFLVYLDASGELIHTDVSQIATISEAEAEQLALEVLTEKPPSLSGSIEHFKYKASPSAACLLYTSDAADDS